MELTHFPDFHFCISMTRTGLLAQWTQSVVLFFSQVLIELATPPPLEGNPRICASLGNPRLVTLWHLSVVSSNEGIDSWANNNNTASYRMCFTLNKRSFAWRKQIVARNNACDSSCGNANNTNLKDMALNRQPTFTTRKSIQMKQNWPYLLVGCLALNYRKAEQCLVIPV